jgi:predicted transposase YdaD
MHTNYEYQSDFARKYFGEGLEKGREEGREEGIETGAARESASMILELLSDRGIAVPADTETRIRACADLDTLRRWRRRAAHAKAVEDVFAEG